MKHPIFFLYRLFNVILTIWAFITTLLFASNGVNMVNEGNLKSGILIIVVSAIYIILVFAILVLKNKANKSDSVKLKLKKINLFKNIVHLLIVLLSIVCITGIFSLSSFFKKLNVMWICITIVFDITYFIIRAIWNKFMKLIKKD